MPKSLPDVFTDLTRSPNVGGATLVLASRLTDANKLDKGIGKPITVSCPALSKEGKRRRKLEDFLKLLF